MPQFILNTEGETAAFDALDELTQGFIECIFFMSQCTADVAFTNQTGQLDTVYICPWPMTDDPKFIKRDWLHPEIQDAIREGQSDGEIPCDAGIADVDAESLKAAADFVAAWYADNKELADKAIAIQGASSVGHDICFTYTGSGVGFWDRNELEADGLGEALSEATGRGEICAAYDPERDVVYFDLM